MRPSIAKVFGGRFYIRVLVIWPRHVFPEPGRIVDTCHTLLGGTVIDLAMCPSFHAIGEQIMRTPDIDRGDIDFLRKQKRLIPRNIRNAAGE